jgi:uncharacterized RDD family membrane protein YckC
VMTARLPEKSILLRLALFIRGKSMECPCCQSQVGASAKTCEVCGEPIPPGQYLLEESGVVEPTENAGPAPAVSLPARNPAGYRFARLGDRFIAFVLDTTLLFGLFAIVDAWVFMRWGTLEGTELQLTTASLLLAITINALILFLYGWLLEAACGATLGKAMVGIRVVGTARRGPLAACAVRNVLRIVDGLGLYLVGTVTAACSRVRQRIGDIYAQTAVIEESFGRAIRVTAIVLWLAILAGAGWAVPRICSSNNAIPTPYLNQVVVRVGKSENSVYFRVARFSVDVQLASAAQ